MFKRILLTGLGLVLLVGLLAGVKVQQFMAMAETHFMSNLGK